MRAVLGQTPPPTAPTAVPLAAETVTRAGFSDQERGYASTIAGKARVVTQSLERGRDLLQDPRFGEEDWTIQLAAVLAVWKLVHEEVAAIEPPPAFADVHATYVEATALLDSAADDIAVGTDTVDPARFSEALPKIGEAGRLMSDAADGVLRLRQDRGEA